MHTPRIPMQRQWFDTMIGRLDRVLSEFLEAAKALDGSSPGLGELDPIDVQTIKHHADDLIGVGNAALEAIKRRGLNRSDDARA